MAGPSVFEVVVPDSIWVTERPIWFSGVRLRSRTTVVRLSDTRASKALPESIAQMRALPLQRILVAHADPITDRPIQQLAEASDFAIPSHLRRLAS